MQLKIHIYSTRPADNVHVGDVVDGGARGPVVINEVRHTLEGVSLLGHRVGSNAGRREHLRYDRSDLVNLLPKPDYVGTIWAKLCEAVAEASNSYEDEEGEPPPYETGSAPGDVDATLLQPVIIIRTHPRHAPYEIRLSVNPDPEPRHHEPIMVTDDQGKFMPLADLDALPGPGHLADDD